jgi:hypothetical protein
MKHPILICAALIITGLFFNCKKKDKISSGTVNGIVMNRCTDQGDAGHTVRLIIIDEHDEVKDYSTVSGSGGQFNFNDVEIHSDSKYSYKLLIESSRITTPNSVGFQGASADFTKDEMNQTFQLNIVPNLKQFCTLRSFTNTIVAPDSFNISYEQRIFNKNFPGQEVRGSITSRSQPYHCISPQGPMGWYIFHHKKWKGGVYSEFTDSIFHEYRSEKQYVINW